MPPRKLCLHLLDPEGPKLFLTWINASLSPKLLRYTSGQALWVHLEDVLAKSANAYVLGLKARLQDLKFTSLEEYLSEAREIVDELEAAGSPMSDCELTSCILEGLPKDYEVVAATRNQPHPVPQQELHDLLLSHITQKRNLAHKQGLKARLQTLKYSKYNYMQAYLSEAQVIADGLKAEGFPVNDLELTSYSINLMMNWLPPSGINLAP